MKNSKVAVIGLTAGFIILMGAYAFAGCHTYPKGAGIINSCIVTNDKKGNMNYYIYVTEHELDAEGREVIKCYELTKEEYSTYKAGDEYIPH